jgi:hypothetical protein
VLATRFRFIEPPPPKPEKPSGRVVLVANPDGNSRF